MNPKYIYEFIIKLEVICFCEADGSSKGKTGRWYRKAPSALFII
jgi:hypothetical protein